MSRRPQINNTPFFCATFVLVCACLLHYQPPNNEKTTTNNASESEKKDLLVFPDHCVWDGQRYSHKDVVHAITPGHFVVLIPHENVSWQQIQTMTLKLNAQGYSVTICIEENETES